MYFELNVISELFLIAGIQSTTNLKIYEQEKILLTLQTESSSEESLKEKRHVFIGMCSFFTWLNMQIPNLRHVRHSIFAALSNI